MRVLLVYITIAALLGMPPAGEASSLKRAPIHHWLLAQPVSTCFRWYLWSLTLSPNAPPGGLSAQDEALSYHVDNPQVDQLLKHGTRERHKPSNDMQSDVSVVYAPAQHAVLFHQYGYEENQVVLMGDVASPPVTVASMPLDHYRSKLGVRLGMSKAALIRIFGPPGKMKTACGMSAFGYAVSNPPPVPTGCGWDYIFVFKNDALIAASFGESC
jgi:hypothetical protein